MNIFRFSIHAFRTAGIQRSVFIVILKLYRKIFSRRTDTTIRNSPVQEFPEKNFTGILSLNATTAFRFKKSFPAEFSFLISSAQKIRTRQFDFLGRSFIFGQTINWHYDPATGKNWKKKNYRETSLHYEGSPLDPKPVWELNRHQYFVTLAQASYLSGDRVYADELIAEWLHWIRENPYRTGINWASPLEIGVRLISWTIAFQFIQPYLSSLDRKTITHSIWQQTAFLFSHLSLDKAVRTNHLIGEAAGLFIAASSFTFQESERWKAKAKDVLEQEMESQVFGDGVVREQSSSYHRFDVDFFLIVYLTARKFGNKFSHHFDERLQKMIRCLDLLQTPDHSLPCFGDCDNGRGFMVAPSINFWDTRGLVSTARILFSNKELTCQDPNEEAFWLLTESEWNSHKELSEISSSETCCVLEQSGYVVLRNGYSPTGDYCFFRAGEFGMGGNGFSSHSHNDLFSPIMYLYGNVILADTGTSIYLGNDDERNYLRSSEAHNTTFAPSWKFFEIQRGFGWKKILNGTILRKTQTDEEVRIECGYEKSSRVPYKRTIIYQPNARCFQINDAFTEDIGDVHSYFHLESGLSVRVNGENILFQKKDKTIAQCTCSTHLQLHVEQSWISKYYGIKEPAVVLHFTWSTTARQPALFTFVGVQN